MGGVRAAGVMSRELHPLSESSLCRERSLNTFLPLLISVSSSLADSCPDNARAVATQEVRVTPTTPTKVYSLQEHSTKVTSCGIKHHQVSLILIKRNNFFLLNTVVFICIETVSVI